MKPNAAEWLDKAEGDYATALRELRARRQPNYDAACFHAQQAAEKYLKGLLQEHGIQFERTHNLVYLLNRLPGREPAWRSMRANLAILTASAIEVRYPGRTATRADAAEAVRICRSVRTAVRASLGLD